jgi:DNA-binding protein HU-beta
MAIGKADLVKLVASKTGKSHKETAASLDATLEVVKESLGKGETVRLVGFGVFAVRDVAASVRVNPQTRAKITVPAHKRVRFAAGKVLSEAVAKRAVSAGSKSGKNGKR